MDVTNAMVLKFERSSILGTLVQWCARHMLSLFANDMAMFIKPLPNELLAVQEAFGLFRGSSSLVATLNRTSIVSVRREFNEAQRITAFFSY